MSIMPKSNKESAVSHIQSVGLHGDQTHHNAGAPLETLGAKIGGATSPEGLIRALLLCNIAAIFSIYNALASYYGLEVAALTCVSVLFVSFSGIMLQKIISKMQTQSSVTRPTRNSRLLTYAVALFIGAFWALLPPSITNLTSNGNMAVSLIVLGCTFGATAFFAFRLPYVASVFFLPILISCFVAASKLAPSQGLPITFGLIAFCLSLMFAVCSHKHFKIEDRGSKKTLAKRDKTISMLLRDFDKQSQHWLWETNNEDRFVRVQESFLDVVARPASELQNITIAELLAPVSSTSSAIEPLLNCIENRQSFTDIHIPIMIKGATHWWSMTGMPDFDHNGVYKGFQGVGSDITEQKLADEHIQFLAHHDVLTGLHNRARFTELLNQNVIQLERYGSTFALMFFDLDFFKSVNDSYGHPTGDKLLIEVGKRISALMPSDAPISRLGGDEFAVIFPGVSSSVELEKVASAALSEICRPFDIDGEQLQIGVSIGIAFAPHHGTRPDQLLRNADLALYRAKENGRNAFCVFESNMDSVARERRALEFDLRYALEGGELELYYQPFVAAQSGKPIGFEALLRWNHPIRGQISPTEFIPIAEATGLIGLIGEWVILEACRAAASWPEHLKIAVNLSALQFSKDQIVEIVTSSLMRSGLRPDRLELEITESLLIAHPEDAIAKLLHLKNLGVSIAMDDFGTGYSSLSYMLKFPFDKIKVDKSFITSVRNESAASDVLRTIASLGKSLKVKMTAEGVETYEQVEFLRELHFDQLQGFYYSRPLRSEEVPALLLSMTSQSLSRDDRKVVSLRSTAA